MDWSKLDAGLAAALADGRVDDRYVVFVHLDPASGADGPGVPPGVGPVRTATVSAAEVAQLTERAEVRQVRLSHALGLRRPT